MKRLIPWLLAHLAHIPRDQITLLNSLGTPSSKSRAELEKLLTPEWSAIIACSNTSRRSRGVGPVRHDA